MAGAGWALLCRPWSVFLSGTGWVLCARWCQLGNLEGSCSEGAFTAAASEHYLWLLPPASLGPSRSVLQGLERLPGSERSCCHTALTAGVC